MIDPQSYVINFDLSELINEVSDVKEVYTDFGTAVQEMAKGVKTDVVELKGYIDGLSESVINVTSLLDSMYDLHNSHMGLTIGNLEEFSKKAEDIATNITKISGFTLKDSVGAQTADTVQDRLSDILPSSSLAMDAGTAGAAAEAAQSTADAALDKAERAAKSAKDAVKDVEESESQLKALTKEITGRVRGELEKGKDAMVGTVGRGIPGGIKGGIIGSLLGMMILGIREDVRKQAERGEVANVFEAATNSIFDRETNKAVRWFADFQEKAQYYYGIGRKEVQRVVKQFVDAGFEVDQLTEKFDQRLGIVGSNVETVTLGLDKMWGVATGASSQNVIKLVAEYGDQLDEAADKYTRLTFAAQRSGMGVSRFVDSVMTGSQALTQYGIDVEDVVGVMSKLQEHYEAMGLTKQFAGQRAARGLSGIAAGISGMSGGFRALVAQRVTPGRDIYDTLQQFQEGFRRVAAGKAEGFLQKTIEAVSSVSTEMVGTDRNKRIFYLQQQGFSNEGATDIADAAAKFEKGRKISELGNAEREKLIKVFQTEGTQMSEMQKTQRQLIEGLSKIGEGVLEILTGILGASIAGWRGLIAAISALFMPAQERNKALDKISAAMEGQFDSLLKGVDTIAEGSKKLGGTQLGGKLQDIVAPVKKALKTDFIGPSAGFTGEPAVILRQAVLGQTREEAVESTVKAQRMRGFLLDSIMEETSDWWNNTFGPGKEGVIIEEEERESLKESFQREEEGGRMSPVPYPLQQITERPSTPAMEEMGMPAAQTVQESPRMPSPARRVPTTESTRLVSQQPVQAITVRSMIDQGDIRDAVLKGEIQAVGE